MDIVGYADQLSVAPGETIRFMARTATASVTDTRPDGAKLEGDTIIQLELPGAGRIQIETQSWVSQTSMLLTGKILVDGRVFFEKQWWR